MKGGDLTTWRNQDLAGHVRAGRKLPWFLLREWGWSERRDPTPAEFCAYLTALCLPLPDWLTSNGLGRPHWTAPSGTS